MLPVPKLLRWLAGYFFLVLLHIDITKDPKSLHFKTNRAKNFQEKTQRVNCLHTADCRLNPCGAGCS